MFITDGGNPVYTSNGYQNDWDGSKDGKALPDGVYFYSIIGNNIEYTGAINLLRFKKVIFYLNITDSLFFFIHFFQHFFRKSLSFN